MHTRGVEIGTGETGACLNQQITDTASPDVPAPKNCFVRLNSGVRPNGWTLALAAFRQLFPICRTRLCWSESSRTVERISRPQHRRLRPPEVVQRIRCERVRCRFAAYQAFCRELYIRIRCLSKCHFGHGAVTKPYPSAGARSLSAIDFEPYSDRSWRGIGAAYEPPWLARMRRQF
jgi:hypothetical protein